MESDSPALAEWLAGILADENEDLHLFDDPLDEDETRQERRLIWSFPSAELRDEYLSGISLRPEEEEVRKVIDRLLIPSGAFGSDHLKYESYLALKSRDDLDDRSVDALRRLESVDHMQRVIRYYSFQSDEVPWQGVNWIMSLLPDWPRLALNVLEAFFRAQIWALTDSMIFAIDDAEAVIRARYIGMPASAERLIVLLKELTPRQFEQTVENLYARIGYKTELTPPSRDGGRDVLAHMSTPGMRESVLVECKRYESKVGVELVRALRGVVGTEAVNKGVLVTTSDFTRGAREFEKGDHRIELISGSQLVLLLNEYLGWSWPARIDILANRPPF